MGRRRDENVFMMLIDAPWWLGVVAAGLFYLGLSVIVPTFFLKGDMGKSIAPMCVMLGKLFAGLALLCASISAIRALIQRASSGGGTGRVEAGQGGNASPACPVCGRTMVRRTARKGSNAGAQFWGCPSYPACRGVVNS